MGNCSGASGSDEEKQQSREIETSLKADAFAIKHETKILLLGTGESGKSTIVKQLRFIYINDFREEEFRSYVPIVHNNVIQTIHILAKALLAQNKLEGQPQQIQEYAALLSQAEVSLRNDLNSELLDPIRAIWQLEVAKNLFMNKGQLQLIESADYFLDQLDRISPQGYLPNEEDIIKSRTKTVGINEINFKLAGVAIRIVDVGGQRSERRKWIHCFEDVSIIFFIVAISEYDQVLREDSSTNRLTESMHLFQEISSCEWFKPTPIMLFLNKSDLFKNKIQRSPLSDHFPEFTDGSDFEKATKFLEKKFQDLNGWRARDLYVHVTCATDKDNVGFVFKSFQKIFLDKRLDNLGVAM